MSDLLFAAVVICVSAAHPCEYTTLMYGNFSSKSECLASVRHYADADHDVACATFDPRRPTQHHVFKTTP